MIGKFSKKKTRKNNDRSGNIKRSEEIRQIIAKECKLEFASVHNKTHFMSGQNISYFDCMGVLYLLQRTFNVKLPESSYAKYRTVGDLIRDVNRQSRKNTR